MTMKLPNAHQPGNGSALALANAASDKAAAVTAATTRWVRMSRDVIV